MSEFTNSYTKLQEKAYKIAVEKGFYENNPSHGDLICMMHSELSEAMEAIRIGNPPDDKLPQFSSVEVELADVIIRIMGYAGFHNLRIAEAVEEKINYNKTRERMHGKIL